MKQIFHHYLIWEDWKNGMWRSESKTYDDRELPFIIDFTGDHLKYGKSMLDVVNEWAISCEHNLSNKSINRKAWVGQAACCHFNRWPEYLVRKSWWHLSNEQRYLADNEALKAISEWEQKQKLKNMFHYGKEGATQMAFQMKLQMN